MELYQIVEFAYENPDLVILGAGVTHITICGLKMTSALGEITKTLRRMTTSLDDIFPYKQTDNNIYKEENGD